MWLWIVLVVLAVMAALLIYAACCVDGDRRIGNVLARCQKDVMDASRQKWYNNTVKF